MEVQAGDEVRGNAASQQLLEHGLNRDDDRPLAQPGKLVDVAGERRPGRHEYRRVSRGAVPQYFDARPRQVGRQVEEYVFAGDACIPQHGDHLQPRVADEVLQRAARLAMEFRAMLGGVRQRDYFEAQHDVDVCGPQHFVYVRLFGGGQKEHAPFVQLIRNVHHRQGRLDQRQVLFGHDHPGDFVPPQQLGQVITQPNPAQQERAGGAGAIRAILCARLRLNELLGFFNGAIAAVQVNGAAGGRRVKRLRPRASEPGRMNGAASKRGPGPAAAGTLGQVLDVHRAQPVGGLSS